MLTLLVTVLFFSNSDASSRRLPDYLLVGTATSAHQIEGAWNSEGKGENIWDRFVHAHPENVVDGTNADVACDSYHKYETDVGLVKNSGFQYYRFSISWSRVLPQGHSYLVNHRAIKYYGDLIDLLLANGVVPVVTLYHFDLPQALQELGGWTNSKVVDWFEDYADVVFKNFGDRVKFWFTINEPKQVCMYGYAQSFLAPGIAANGVGDYMCARNLLLAHASAYRLYKKRYDNGDGRIGIVVEGTWYEPGSEADAEAVDRQIQFDFGLYVHPIYFGDFPAVVKNAVANRSRLEGFSESRLPALTRDEVDFIRNTTDFFGLNYYTSFYVRDKVPEPVGAPSSEKDVAVDLYQDPQWPSSAIDLFKSVPWGLRKLLAYIKRNYEDPEVVIGENGFADFGEIRDCARVKFYLDHLNAVLDAVSEDQVRVTMYSAWSLMDNFEWTHGYSVCMGLHGVNFTDPDLKRVPKLSAKFFAHLLATRMLPNEFGHC